MALAIYQHENSAAATLTEVGKLPVICACSACVLFAAAAWNHVDLYVEKPDVGLDPFVLIKLSFAGLGLVLGTHAFLSDSRVRDVAMSWPGVLVLAIFLLYIVSSFLSAGFVQGVVSSSSIVSMYLLTIAVALQLGRPTVLQILFYASALFIAGSWVVFFLKPEIGVLMEPLADGSFRKRMSGLSHANTLGQFCGLNLILGIVLYFSYRQRGWILVAILLMSLAALVNCLSRASTLALLVAVVTGYRSFLVTRESVKLFLLIATLLGFGLFIYLAEANLEKAIEQRMSMLSKSGDAEEITSGTGRSQIWAESISLIKQRPLIGYGPATSKQLLADYSSYTHNLILNITLSAGLFGGLLGIIMILSRLLMMLRFHHPAADALVAFIVINGLVENTIFSTICGFPTIAWTLGLTWFAMNKHLTRSNNQ